METVHETTFCNMNRISHMRSVIIGGYFLAGPKIDQMKIEITSFTV
jgi:hypothetical protein